MLPRPAESQRLPFEDFLGWFAEQTQLGAQQQRMAAAAELASALTELLQVMPESELAVAASEMIALALRASLTTAQDDIGREALAEAAQSVYALAEAATDDEVVTNAGSIYAAIQEATENLLQ